MVYRYGLCLLLLMLFATTTNAQIKINEILASNSDTNEDEFGNSDDWVEILNLGDVSVDFGGMYVSDDPENLLKWQIPTSQSASTTIAPGQFLLIWFDGEPDEGALHVDMKLSSGGEFVILTDADGTTRIDSIAFPEQSEDISWGATVDGGDSFTFQNPTPGATNDGSVILEQAEAPVFTLETGFYSGSQVIGLSTETEGVEIRYTLDASRPTVSSLLYNPTEFITIDTSVVIRAAAMGEGFLTSEVSTNTYLYGDTHIFPVVSFVMDPDSLFGNEVGMYALGDTAETEYPFRGANFWQDWEYPMHLEFMGTDGNIEFEMDAGASIGGNFSRGFNKKSFILNNNAEYGIDRLEYELFPENDYDSYDGFGLRAGAEERSRLLNELLYAINQKWKHNNDMQANRPVILYLNGEYWGIYSLQERKNDDFVESRYGFEDIDMIKDYDGLKDGDWETYWDLVDGIDEMDASNPAFYEFLEENINLDSFTDHWVYQVYTSHGDPNNLRYWRAREDSAKWHYISHDFDWWENLGREPEEYTAKLKPFLEMGTYDFWILGKMMENPMYQEFFLNRLADMLNTAFKPENIFALIDSIDTAIEPEMARDIDRWTEGWRDIGGPTSYDMEYIRSVTEDYAVDYPQYIYSEVLDTLGADTLRVEIAQLFGGSVKLNSIYPDAKNGSWSGLYFSGTTIELTAIPEAGSSFTGWTVNGESAGSSATLEIALTDTVIILEAEFMSIDEVVVINEINYNSSDDRDTGDWIELYNPGGSEIDLSGWTYKDSNDDNEFIIPEGTTIASGDYLVLSHDLEEFSEFWMDTEDVIGGVDFGLSGSGDQVRIYNTSDQLIDMVTYDDEAPWPVEPDGEGATLSLNDYTDDNSLAESWYADTNVGTPGLSNDTILDSNEESETTPIDFVLNQNYPNPFNPTTNISFSLPEAVQVELTIFNVLGQQVQTLVSDNLGAGAHTYTFNASGLTSGVYFYRIVAGSNTATQKMLLLK